MPEILLHYIWEHCLWADFLQQTTDGQPIEIISVGEHNRDAGPDYSHARVRIGGREWVGNIELHIHSSEWYKHNHHLDRAYDTVILHVVRDADKQVFNSRGEAIPQCALQYPNGQDYLTGLLTDAMRMDSATSRIGCAQQLLEDPGLLTDGWRQHLLRKRLDCKRASIERLLTITQGSWEHAFYISLARNFGFHINSVPFEELAIATPLSALRKHRDNLFQLTAMLLGQSGLPIHDEQMAREYAFLRTKFGLTPIDGSLWKLGRIRPQNSPERRIRQFANLLHRSEFLFSRVIELQDIDSLVELFAQESFGRASIDILLINTVIPYRYAYALRSAAGDGQSAMLLMEQIAAEDNTVIRQWRMLGQQISTAADSQALLHLYQNYCQHHECVNCDVGYRIFFEQRLPQ
ncbi:MAG: DUF2851 family protein [Paludibacteraceae bacterium]|nr:DUF2851 family protein [Paludibacteraceae bacterium]